MSTVAQYDISLRDADAVEPFVREYLLDALDRIEGYDEAEHVSFAPGRDPETGDRSVVVLQVRGEPESVLEREESRLAAHRESGLVEDWEQSMATTTEEIEAMQGPRTTALAQTMAGLSAEMARLAYETFDEFPEAVDTVPDEDAPEPVGWWVLVHTLTVQANYSLQEELRTYEFGIEHTLRNIAEYEGEAAADDRLDALLASLEETRDRVKEGRNDP